MRKDGTNDDPRHGEVRQIAFVRNPDSFTVTYALYLDPRETVAAALRSQSNIEGGE